MGHVKQLGYLFTVTIGGHVNYMANGYQNNNYKNQLLFSCLMATQIKIQEHDC